MQNRKISSLFLLLCFGLISSLSCQSLSSIPTPTSTPTDTPVPTNTPVPTPTPIIYDNKWSGITSQGFDISFTIINNEVTNLGIKIELVGASCTSTVETTGTYTFTTPYPIVDGAFTVIDKVNDGATYTFTGTFDSPKSALGTLEYASVSGCAGNVNVDWTATKNP